MKKTLLCAIIVGAAFVLSGCAKPGAVDQGTKQNQQDNSSKSSVITSIKEAMGLGKKMECTYTTKINDKEIKAVMQTDGKNFKSSSEIDGRKMYSVMKDEVSYTWGEGMPMSSKLAMSCINDLPKMEGQESAPSFQEPEKAFDAATNVVCVPIASVDISIPDNIQFQDMCEMMKGMMNMAKDMKIPSGASNPNIPNIPVR